MSLEDRLRQSFAAAIDDARSKLDAELQTAFASMNLEKERVREEALAAARLAAEADLAKAFEDEKAALAASHAAALDELRQSSDATLAAARQEAEAALVDARAEAERGLIELDRLRQQAEVQAAAVREADEARVRAVDVLAASARRLLDGVKALDDATSLSEVLDALTAAAASEAGRAAMLVVKGDRLLGWRTSGFGDLDAQPRTIESSASDADALARAVATGRPVVTGSGPASSVPSFVSADAGRTGIAVPLLVGGRAVAVVYADAPGTAAEGATTQAAIDVFVRHAGRCLEALTVQRAAQARTSAVRVSTPA
jgi:hypothetical protein